LEVGVGTGLSLPYYPPHCEIVGIDISGAMLEKASNRSRELGMRGATFLKMGAEQMTFSEGAFDVVLASYVISTVPDPQRVLSELGRVCRPGGTIVLLNHFQSRHRIIAMGEKVLTPLSRRLGFVLDLTLDRLLTNGDLETESVEKVNIPPLWSLVRLRRKTGPARLKLQSPSTH
jgi:phosphatidylethanolamine/phosphatidyl-N-methylethanolamine N-methyltransferase